MTVKKEISRNGPVQKDGKTDARAQLQNGKSTAKPIEVKYTFVRSEDDIKKLEKLRIHLKSKFWNKSYNTDSEIYRNLPDLYLNAVKKNQDLDLAIDELTAKLDQLEDLRASFCRIFEICELKK